LHERIQKAEHDLYPKCVAAIAAARVKVASRRTTWAV